MRRNIRFLSLVAMPLLCTKMMKKHWWNIPWSLAETAMAMRGRKVLAVEVSQWTHQIAVRWVSPSRWNLLPAIRGFTFRLPSPTETSTGTTYMWTRVNRWLRPPTLLPAGLIPLTTLAIHPRQWGLCAGFIRSNKFQAM